VGGGRHAPRDLHPFERRQTLLKTLGQRDEFGDDDDEQRFRRPTDIASQSAARKPDGERNVLNMTYGARSC